MDNEEYVVQEGDTIISVAQEFGVRIIDLIEENNLENTYYLIPGSLLTIPNNLPLGFTYYTVKSGDTLYSIANMFNIDMDDLASINGLEINEYLFPNQKLLVPKDDVYAYITKEGDTLVNIADSLSINPEDILLYNKRIYLLPEQLIAYKIRDNN